MHPSTASPAAVNPAAVKPGSYLYVTDFHAWTEEQIALLRNHQWSQLDLPNLIEELECLGKQQRQELRNRLSVLMGHLLKWQYQPHCRSRSWLATIRIQRLDIADLLDDNPSLKPYLVQVLQRAYLRGVAIAIEETELPDHVFPSDCPYTLTEMLDNCFYPGEPSELVSESEH